MKDLITDSLTPEAIRAIRRTLSAILRKTSGVNREVALISDLLDGAAPPTETRDDGLAGGASAAILAAPLNGSHRAFAGGKRYEVRTVDGELRLLESREEGGAPFAVPERVYRAFAAATAANSGKKYDQIYRKVMQDIGEAARDYQGRVCYRFWQSKGLLTRDRSRYAVVGPRDSFAARALAAWEEVKVGDQG